MKLPRLRVMPLAWLAFSIMYLITMLSIEERRMPGAQWDPGSTALPLGVAVAMIVLAGLLVVRDTKLPSAPGQSDASAAEPETAEDLATRRLTIATGIITIGYILIFRQIGYVVSTTLLVFLLTYWYQLGNVSLSSVGVLIKYTAGSVVTGAVSFAIGVWLLAWVRYFGRIWEVDILRNRTFAAFLGLVFWSALLVPLFRFMIRRAPAGDSKADAQSRAARGALILSVATTLLVYLIFQQVFRVSLPEGIL